MGLARKAGTEEMLVEMGVDAGSGFGSRGRGMRGRGRFDPGELPGSHLPAEIIYSSWSCSQRCS